MSNTTNPSLPPYPGRPKVYGLWMVRDGAPKWHKAIEHHTPQALRLRGPVLDWLVRACDGFDGPTLKRRETPPTSGRRCRECFT